MKLADELHRLGCPAPWTITARYTVRGPYWTYLDANGRDANDAVYASMADARVLQAVTVCAPRAFAYVEQAAAKGGKEAQAIMADFWIVARASA
ncbi:hypothetical protein ACFPIF_09920 [Brevundimonas faecalis]|uniref:hypothetical protein n=1 Tax=Brevundimonas faecalis TaxID=947378 RepID=UPI003606C3EB